MAWAELTDVRCYYEVLGDGEPLLLIPGLGTTCRLWDPVIPELARHFSLILPDARDVGRSISYRRARHLTDFVADLVELMDHLQLDSSHVMGISLGGVIAQRLAIDHPSLIKKLVLVSCADGFSPYLKQVFGLLGQALRKFSAENFVRTVEILGSAPQHFDANVDLIEQRVKAKCNSGISARAVATQLRCLACSEVDPSRFQIVAPTLVMAGESDALIPSCYSRQMAARIADSCFVEIPGTGHNPLSDSPERTVPILLDFLQEGPPKNEFAYDVIAKRGANKEVAARGPEFPGRHSRFE